MSRRPTQEDLDARQPPYDHMTTAPTTDMRHLTKDRPLNRPGGIAQFQDTCNDPSAAQEPKDFIDNSS